MILDGLNRILNSGGAPAQFLPPRLLYSYIPPRLSLSIFILGTP